jgi:hypothetical protein
LVEVPLQPVELFEGIREGGRDVGGRFAVQPLRLDQPGSSRRGPEGAPKVARGLGVVVGALPTGGVTACDRQPRSRTSFMITFGLASTR